MKILYAHKKLFFDYEVLQTRDAGLVLLGHEVKSLKNKQASLNESIIKIKNNSLYIVGMQIQLYKKASRNIVGSYQKDRERELLLQKKELVKIIPHVQAKKGILTWDKIFIAKNGFIKCRIALAVRKKKFEKKQSIKEKDVDRQAKKDIKNLGI